MHAICRTCGFTDCPGATGGDCPRWPARNPDTPGINELLADLDKLIGIWRRFIRDYPADGPYVAYVAGITLCAEQLSWRLERHRIWRCMGCGDEYTGPPELHRCPMIVRSLTGCIGIYGKDWTYA